MQLCDVSRGYRVERSWTRAIGRVHDVVVISGRFRVDGSQTGGGLRSRAAANWTASSGRKRPGGADADPAERQGDRRWARCGGAAQGWRSVTSDERTARAWLTVSKGGRRS